MAGGPLHAAAAAGGTKTWATPGRLLALFCTMCLFVYLDRGLIASNGVNGTAATEEHPASGIQGDFELSLFQDGLLPAAFMVGLLVSSPVFAEASKHHNGFRLIGIGLAVWTVAVVGCGLAAGFTMLLLCRMAVGVGEASFVALAAPFIDDHAPPARKSLWLGLFYCCIPTGYALGYIAGGLVGSWLGWRAAFLLEAAAMLPFVIFCLRAPAISLRGSKESHAAGGAHGKGNGAHGHASGGDVLAAVGDGEGAMQSHAAARPSLLARLAGASRAVGADMAVLWRHPVYLWTVVGMTFYTAVLGSFAFYGPKAGRDVFKIAPETADLTFGAITVVTGTLGTLLGGVLLDAVGATLRNALLVCAAGIALGALLSVAAFWLSGSFAMFALVFALAEMGMFVSQAPGNAVVMWGVPSALRPFAMSMSVVAMHVLGDVPSPPLLGALQGRLQNWRASMCIASAFLMVGAAAYLMGAFVARTATDYRELMSMVDDVEGSSGLGDPERGDGSRAGSRGSSRGGGGGGEDGAELLARHSRPAGGAFAALAAAADDDDEGSGLGRQQQEAWEEGDASALRIPSPDRPLLPSSAHRSS